LPKLSESSIENTTDFALSGLGISFWKTLHCITHKTVTRRAWKHKHAQKFINAFHQNKLVKAWDKDIRYGGKQIGWCRLLCAPYKEKLAAMPEEDLQAEGGMCSSVAEFIKQYFKGNTSQEVWVIRFEFVALNQVASTKTVAVLGVCSDSGTKANSTSALTSLAASIHQTQLLCCGVYPASESKTDRYSFIASATKSIHQASFTPFGVYSSSGSKNDRSSLICPATKSIHQDSLTILGVYSNSGSKTDRYSFIASATKSIHQALFNPLGVYSATEHKTNSYFPFSLSIDSIHQVSHEPRSSFSVCSNDSNPGDSNDSVHSTTESIESPSASASLEHQTIPDLYQNNGNEVDINTPISLRNYSIQQDCLSSLGVYSNSNNQTDTNAPNNSLAESIHQAQSVQGGSGLVYSFWKRESIVNHYRYKVKVNGKWKVKSIYIPVGKLPKVREAIASNLGVTAIVTEILNRKL
jgi:hypothetical protein